MDHPTDDAPAAPGWSEARQASIAATLEESEAQIAAGQTVLLEPVLKRLREGAERIEARLRVKAAGHA